MEVTRRLKKERVYTIADALSITNVQIATIVNTFFRLCREDLLTGHTVHLIGFVKLTPNVVVDDYVSTVANYCKRVAEVEGMTYITVREVMRQYFDGCQDDLDTGKTIVFRSLVTIYPVKMAGKFHSYYTSISHTVKAELEKRNSGVTSARSHICKFCKSKLSETSTVEGVSI